MENFNVEVDQVKNEWRIIQHQWNETSDVWIDAVRKQFEKQFWSEIERLMHAYMKKLEETSEMTNRIARDLSR